MPVWLVLDPCHGITLPGRVRLGEQGELPGDGELLQGHAEGTELV